MMIATGFPAIGPSKQRKKEAADYRDGLRGGKNAAPILSMNAQEERKHAKRSISAPLCGIYARALTVEGGERGRPNFRQFMRANVHSVYLLLLRLLRRNAGMGDLRHAPGQRPAPIRP
jgi:hypothetical protein